MKRREFLKGAAIVPASVAASRWSAIAEKLGAGQSKITAVVYDERYADCRMFADALVRRGAVSFATGGDVVSIWYGALRDHLSRFGGSVAGMTTDADLSASRECGRELGLRIVYEGSHDGRVPGRLQHHLRGRDEANAVYGALLRGDESWAESIAEGLASPTLTEQIIEAVAGSSSVTTPRPAGYRGYLTSWLLRANRREDSALEPVASAVRAPRE